MAFLPTTRAEMKERGWDCVDFAYVCGDAYVDHSSFGAAIITRLLEAKGFRVGIIAQPDWRRDDSIAVFGKPRLGFLVSAGNMDSMVNHFTVARKRRSRDAYSPGGQMGLRPDRAAIVYGNLIRRTFKDSPIILGGIEASLRRLAHYDYWSDTMRRSILLDSCADLISYGMGEHSIVAIAEALDAGLDIRDITFVDGTVYRADSLESVFDAEVLPAFEELQADRLAYARSFAVQYRESDPVRGKRLVEPYARDGALADAHGERYIYVVQNPPAAPLSTAEMDAVYRLPFERTWHPSYDAAGGVPALSEVEFSLTSSRGCFGECAFCALTFHQGRMVSARSHDALVQEAELLTQLPNFKGYLHDVGGPTADFRAPACERQLERGACANKRCLSPKPCANLRVNHKDYLRLLRRLRTLPGVKKVFVRSGIRFDYVLAEPDGGAAFTRELCEHHVSGQLRVAPEHVSADVLECMGKPPREVYERFAQLFARTNERLGKKQYLVPYLMSSHPGSGLREAIELAEFCRDLGYNPEQVQDFYPTPSTLATVMYATGVDPRTMNPVYVVRDSHEKQLQRALIQYRNPQNRALVREALAAAGREDLIGYDPKCLVQPVGKPEGVRAGGAGGRAGKQAGKQTNAHIGKRQGARVGKQGARADKQVAQAKQQQGAQVGKQGTQVGKQGAQAKPQQGVLTKQQQGVRTKQQQQQQGAIPQGSKSTASSKPAKHGAPRTSSSKRKHPPSR